MPRYDIETVKAAAAGRWPEIFSAVASVPTDIFDGQHHPCPKCGGKDRFRLIDGNAGACLCNQCFATKNGDGFAVLQWLTGNDFATVLEATAKHLGVKPEKGKRKADPAEHLEFLPWNGTLVGLWCLKKKPIKPEAVQAIGGRVAKYRGQYTVIAIPVWGSSFNEAEPVGWVIYRADGRELPKWQSGSKEPEWVKVKVTHGSQKGIIGIPKVDPELTSGIIWKTEGPTDLMALLTVQPDSVAFTTANGAKEKPEDWIVKLCEGHRVVILHDADQPGQEGATWIPQRDGQRRPGWCPRIASVALKTWNLTLPFTVEHTHGPDLRDYLNGGGTYADLVKRLEEAEEFKASKDSENFVEESEDDPQRLARVNLERYRNEHDGRLIYWRDEWWKWKEGRYRKIEPSELKAKVWSSIRSEFERCWRESRGKDDRPIRKVNRTLVSNVVGAMESMCSIPTSVPMPCWLPDRSQPHYLTLKNGILDIEGLFEGRDDCLMELSHDWFSSVRLDYEFDAAADCPLWTRFIETSMEGDADRMKVLQEWAGYVLASKTNLQNFLAMEGEGGNGKSVYAAGLTAMIGPDNVSSVPLEKFGGQFDLATTIGKALNICGDVGEIDKAAEAELKQFTGGGLMQFDRKRIEPLTIQPTAKMMMSWNNRPRFHDRSYGLWRRMVLVPFNYKPTGKDRILGMDSHDWWIENGQAPGILLWAIEGLRRLREQKGFTQSKMMLDALADYRVSANPALEFLEEFVEEPEECTGKISKMRLYDMYQHFCQKTGHRRPLAQRAFGKEVLKKFPNVRDGKISFGEKRENCYEGIQFSVDEIFGKDVEPGQLF